MPTSNDKSCICLHKKQCKELFNKFLALGDDYAYMYDFYFTFFLSISPFILSLIITHFKDATTKSFLQLIADLTMIKVF
jgi:hypothetical protein